MHGAGSLDMKRQIQIFKMACEMEVEIFSRNYLDFNDLSKQETLNLTEKLEKKQVTVYSSPTSKDSNGMGCIGNSLFCRPIFPGLQRRDRELKRKHLVTMDANGYASDAQNSREPLELPSKVLYL